MDNETIRHQFDPKKGSHTEPSKIRSGFIMTNHRLVYAEREWWGRSKSKAALLTSVDYLEVQHIPKPFMTLIAAIFMLIVGGYLLGADLALTDFKVSSTFVRYGAISLLVGAGITFLSYMNSGQTTISTQIGSEKISVKFDKAVLEQAEEFQARFFELKMADRAAA